MSNGGGKASANSIAVTGAAGKLGRAVVGALEQFKPAGSLVAITRDPAKLHDFAESGVVVRGADFGNPQRLQTALAGVRQVLIVSVDRLGDEGRRLHRSALDAACAAGVDRVLYTSHMGTHAGSPFSDHFAMEQDLAQDGRPFTSLRHGFYAESALHLIGPFQDSGEIRGPADGPVNWTARTDLAEADARILADEGRFDGVTPPLVATESVTMADIAAIASDLCGRPIKRVVVADELWRESALAAGRPPAMVDALLATHRAARNGEFAAKDPTLERLLGRPTTPMREVMAAHLRGQARAAAGP